MLNITFNKELSFTKNQITASVSENSNIEPIVFQEKTPNKAKIYFPNLEKDTASFTVFLKTAIKSFYESLKDSWSNHTAAKPSTRIQHITRHKKFFAPAVQIN